MVSEKEVVIFTQHACRFCKLEKEWLTHRDIDFKERDITDDPTALSDLEAIPAFTTPVALIDGEVVHGFDRRKLEQLLGI
jgi:glutaredoxin